MIWRTRTKGMGISESDFVTKARIQVKVSFRSERSEP